MITTTTFEQEAATIGTVRDAIVALGDVRGRMAIMLSMTHGRIAQAERSTATTKALTARSVALTAQMVAVAANIEKIKTGAAMAMVSRETVDVLRAANATIREVAVNPESARNVMQDAENARTDVEETAGLLSSLGGQAFLDTTTELEAMMLELAAADDDDDGDIINGSQKEKVETGAIRMSAPHYHQAFDGGDAAGGPAVAVSFV